MKTLEQLRKALEDAVTAQVTILDGLVSDKGERAMNETEKNQFDALTKKANELKTLIDQLEQVEQSRAKLKELGKAAAVVPVVEAIREENCNEAGEYRGFKNLGDFLQAAARCEKRGEQADPRMQKLQRSLATRGFNEGSGAEGGFFVQTDIDQTLFQKVTEDSAIISRCEQVPISTGSDSLEWTEIVEDSRATGSRNGGVRVYRDKEAGTVNESMFKTRQEKIRVEKLTALAYATEENLEDAPQLQALIEPPFIREMGFVMEEEIISGDGNGEMLGILKAPGLITVAKEGSQTADTIVHANIRKMKPRMYPRSLANSLWLIGNGVEEVLEILSFTPASGTSIPVYMPASGISQAGYGTLYGRPVQANEHAAALGDLGDVIFADFSQYRIVKKGGIKSTFSVHVAFINGKVCFRWTARVNGKPMWRAPLTPAKGSLTSGPFVTLEARA